jgi:hypothetical protein
MTTNQTSSWVFREVGVRQNPGLKIFCQRRVLDKQSEILQPPASKPSFELNAQLGANSKLEELRCFY